MPSALLLRIGRDESGRRSVRSSEARLGASPQGSEVGDDLGPPIEVVRRSDVLLVVGSPGTQDEPLGDEPRDRPHLTHARRPAG